MKYLIFFVIICFITFSCKKEEEVKVVGSGLYYGTFNAKKGTIDWDAKAYGVYDTLRWKKDAIGIFGRFFEKNIWKETIAFSEVPLKKGIYPLKRANWSSKQGNVGAVYFIEFENGHVNGEEFVLDTLSQTNRFEVTDYNSENGEVKVKFTATFFIKNRDKASILDTIKFTNGEILTRAYN